MGGPEEQYVIGALLMDLGSICKIYDDLKPEMFVSDLYGRMYVEILRAYDNNQKMDAAILANKIQCDTYPVSIVRQEIKNCAVQAVTSANIKYYAQMVIDEYKTRQLSTVINSIQPTSQNINFQIGELMNNLESLKIGEKTRTKSMKQVVEENKNKYFCDNGSEKILTGFPRLDDQLGGLEGGDMIVIGARPAVGKSAFVTQVITNIATQGKRVGFYNLEMMENQVYERFIVNHSGIGLTRLRRAKKFLGDEEQKFQKANEFLYDQNIMLSTGSKSVNEIRNECKHMDYDIIVVDYLQLLRPDIRRSNRAAEVGEISRGIKGIATEFKVPVIALSQLNRISEMKSDKEPTMAELREAGDVEQDASIILLMWNINDNLTVKGLKTEKNRQGKTGKQVLRFNGERMQFEESKETIKQAAEWSKAEEKTPFDKELR